MVKRVATERIGQLINEPREFQRKHDYRFKHEPRGREWTSPERAIGSLVEPKQEPQDFGDLVPTRRRRR